MALAVTRQYLQCQTILNQLASLKSMYTHTHLFKYSGLLPLRQKPHLESNRGSENKCRQGDNPARQRQWEWEEDGGGRLLPVFDEGLIDATDLWESPFSGGAIQLYLPLRVLPQQC